MSFTSLLSEQGRQELKELERQNPPRPLTAAEKREREAQEKLRLKRRAKGKAQRKARKRNRR